jgi:catechol 2,3-dioxygenase-like lactoylglutathione lyase family enzyme
MKSTFVNVNGMQHIGVAVSDMNKILPIYRKLFGMDIPFFDSIQAAPLMDVYTHGKTITKRASMIMNLQGGCAMEVIEATSFKGKGNLHTFAWGDLGINSVHMKSRNIEKSFAFVKDLVPTKSIQVAPDQRKGFFINDPDGNLFQFVENTEWYSNSGHHSGGVLGTSIGVRDADESMKLYRDILGFDQVVFDETGVFADWAELPNGTEKYRRVLLSKSKPTGGGFGKVTGKNYIELVQALDRVPQKIFKGRMWGDYGFVHLGLDVKGMRELEVQMSQKGFPFTCDSQSALSMGNTKVHCVYIDDPDGTLIEMIEVFKVPIVEKWGLYLNVEKRDPMKPLPDFMLKFLRFSRIKD